MCAQIWDFTGLLRILKSISTSRYCVFDFYGKVVKRVKVSGLLSQIVSEVFMFQQWLRFSDNNHP